MRISPRPRRGSPQQPCGQRRVVRVPHRGWLLLNAHASSVPARPTAVLTFWCRSRKASRRFRAGSNGCPRWTRRASSCSIAGCALAACCSISRKQAASTSFNEGGMSRGGGVVLSQFLWVGQEIIHSTRSTLIRGSSSTEQPLHWRAGRGSQRTRGAAVLPSNRQLAMSRAASTLLPSSSGDGAVSSTLRSRTGSNPEPLDDLRCVWT